MMHCSECDATLKHFDSICWNCNAVMGSRDGRVPKRFCTAVDVLFNLCTVLTLMSLFSDITPAFKLCAAALLVIRLVKSSADEMAKLGSLSAFRVVIKEQNRRWRRAAVPQWQLALEKARRA